MAVGELPVSFPTPGGFPPPGGGDPQFGVNPYGGPNLYLESAFEQNTQLLLQRRAALQQQLMQRAQFAAANSGLGLGLDSDPQGWTPDQAIQQTDRALAKLSTVNPELAEKLAAQRAGQPADGGGFFSDLLHVAGEVLHPGLAAFGKVMEVVGRTASIVPNIVYDLGDGGDFNVIEDIGGAMTGRVNHNWNSVMQQAGILEGDGVAGFLRATIGLGLDIATDPLTYVMPVGAASKMGERAALSAREVATKAPEVLDAFRAAPELAGKTDQEIAEHISFLWDANAQDKLVQGIRVSQGTGEVGDLASRAMTAEFAAMSAEHLSAQKMMYEIGDRVYKLSTGRAWRRAIAENAPIYLRDGTEITARDAKNILEKAVAAGNGAAYGSAEAAAARNFASIIGGPRLHAIVPFTSFRYIGPSANFGMLSKVMPGRALDAFTRFMAGASGLQNLMHRVMLGGEGAPTWEHVTYWMENGWDKFHQKYPEIAQSLRGRGKNFGSMFYSASEHVGGITAHFDSGARAARTGLAHYWAHAQGVEAKNIKNSFLAAVMRKAIGDDRNLGKDMETVFGERLRNDPALAEYLHYFPGGVDTSSPQAVEEWYRTMFPEMGRLEEQEAAVGGALAGDAAESLQKHRTRLASRQRVAGALTEPQKAVLGRLQTVWGVARDTAAQFEAEIGHVGFQFDQVFGIHPNQLADWQGQTGLVHPVVQRKMYLRRGDYTHEQWQAIAQRGVGDAAKIEDERHGYGILLRSERQSADDIEVAARGGDFYQLDESGNASLPLADGRPERGKLDAEAELDELAQNIKAGVASATEGRETLWDKVRATPGESLSEDELASIRRQGIVEEMKARRAQARGSFTPDGDVMVWDPNDVKLVGEEFPHVGEKSGYMHLSLKEEVERWIHGVTPKDEAQILRSVPRIQAEVSRATIGMDFDESNRYLRQYLEDKLRNEWTRAGTPEEEIQAKLAKLPEYLWNTDPLEVHNQYITSLSRDIESRFLGRAMDRLTKIGRIQPALYGTPPRSGEVEWTLPQMVLDDLSKNNKDLAAAVARLNKKGAKFQDRQAKFWADQAENFGHISLLTEEMLNGGYGPPGRELEAVIRYGQGRMDRAREAIATARNHLKSWTEGLDEEERAYRAAEDEVVRRIEAQQEEVNNIIDSMTHEGEGSGLTGRDVVAYEKKFNDFKQSGVAQEVRPGVWHAQVEEYGKVNDIYWKEVDGRIVSVRQVGQDGRAIAETVAEEQGKGYGYELIQQMLEDRNIHSLPDFQEFLRRQIAAAEENQAGAGTLLSKGGAGLNKKVAKYLKEQQTAKARAMFEREVENGNIYVNSNTGSIYTRKGNFVAKGGGRKLRAPYERALERQTIAEKSAHLDDVENALGTPHGPLPEPMEGAPKDVALAERRADRAKAAQREATRYHAAASKRTAKASRLLEKARTEMNNAMAEVNRTLSEAKGLKARVRPALVAIEQAGDMEGLTPMRIPGLEGFAMPEYIAKEFHAIMDISGPGHLQSEWRKWILGPWKRWATYRWPGFHVRNFFGAWFNNFLGGVTLKDYGFATRVERGKGLVSPEEFARYHLGDVWGRDKLGSLTYEDVRAHLARMGVGGANIQQISDVQYHNDFLRAAMDEFSSKPRGGKVGNAAREYDRRLRNLGSRVENFHRYAAWAQGMAATRGDLYGARSFVMMRHGDYSDLTPFEDHIRDLVPFYKWLRTNVPYQIRMLAERPAQMTLVSRKLKRTAYDIAGIDQEQAELAQPDYMKQALTIPIPSWVPVFGSKPDAIKYAMTELPYSDLYNGLNEYISAGFPVVRNLVESWGLHKNTFTGTELSGRMVPLSGVFNWGPVRELLAATPFATKGPDGNVYIDDRMENALSAWPVFSRFRNFAEADPARVQQRLGGLLSMIAGFNIRPEDFTQAELDFYYNEVEPTLQQYRDMGVTFPTAQQFAEASNAVAPSLPAFTPPDNGVIFQAPQAA